MGIPRPRPGAAVLITGASSGIGVELARQMAGRGHDLILLARRRERLDSIAAELRPHRVEVLPCDLSDAAARDRLPAQIHDLGLQVDVLMLCAGYGMGGPFLAQDPERIVHMTRTNLESTFALSRALIPAMVERRSGAVLLVSSIAGHQPMPNFSAYSATKAGITSFGQAMASELAPCGVTVTVLCPGVVHTEFSQVANMDHNKAGMPSALMIGPQEAAREAINGLARGKRVVTPRLFVRAFAFFGMHAPRAMWLPLSRRMMA